MTRRFSLGNEILQEVSDAKYLGIQILSDCQIDNKLDWNKYISTVAARGQSKLAYFNRTLIFKFGFWFMPRKAHMEQPGT